ncbi:MAG: hypothetical protein HY719_13390 [Planctomycetes bacterium]|nr:hypothetical protein [Planctomycetota bacterium]
MVADEQSGDGGASSEADQPFWVRAIEAQGEWRGWEGPFRFLMSLVRRGEDMYPDRRFEGVCRFAYEAVKAVREAFERVERGAYFDFRLLNKYLASFHPEVDTFDERDLKKKWRVKDGVWKPRKFRFNLMPNAGELDDTEFLLMTLLGIVLDEFVDYVRERYADSRYPGWSRGAARVARAAAGGPPRWRMTRAAGPVPAAGKEEPEPPPTREPKVEVRVRRALPAAGGGAARPAAGPAPAPAVRGSRRGAKTKGSPPKAKGRGAKAKVKTKAGARG